MYQTFLLVMGTEFRIPPTAGEPMGNVDILSLGRSSLSEADLLATLWNRMERLFAFVHVEVFVILLATTPNLDRSFDGFN